MNVTSINRQIEIRYTCARTDSDEKKQFVNEEEVMECDYLFIACNMKNALKCLSDETKEEVEIFSTCRRIQIVRQYMKQMLKVDRVMKL